jgi:hypothetical protein
MAVLLLAETNGADLALDSTAKSVTAANPNGVVDGKPVNIPAPVHTKSDGEL